MSWRYCSDSYDIENYYTIGYMHNALMFDSRHRVETFVKRLKSILMRIFWMLEHVQIIAQEHIQVF